MGLAVRRGVPAEAVWLYLPSLAVSVVLVAQVIRGRWRDRATLDKLCGLNIAVNLGTTAALILAFLV
jgi:1,4-dihydroxy-2-naphthoate octaprenyltransferase